MPLMYNRGWSEPPHTEGHHPDMPETLSKPFQRSTFPTPPIQLQISSLIKISSICAVNVFISPTPVSYTHLDVYKRQGLGRCHKPSSPVNISAVIECKLSLCKDDQPYHCLLYTSTFQTLAEHGRRLRGRQPFSLYGYLLPQ